MESLIREEVDLDICSWTWLCAVCNERFSLAYAKGDAEGRFGVPITHFQRTLPDVCMAANMMLPGTLDFFFVPAL